MIRAAEGRLETGELWACDTCHDDGEYDLEVGWKHDRGGTPYQIHEKRICEDCPVCDQCTEDINNRKKNASEWGVILLGTIVLNYCSRACFNALVCDAFEDVAAGSTCGESEQVEHRRPDEPHHLSVEIANAILDLVKDEAANNY